MKYQENKKLNDAIDIAELCQEIEYNSCEFDCINPTCDKIYGYETNNHCPLSTKRYVGDTVHNVCHTGK